MRNAISFVRQHPVIILVYLLYTLLWASVIRTDIIRAGMTGMSRLTVGEGLMYLYIFSLMISILYLTVSLVQALCLKKRRKLYLRLSLLIIVPAAIVTVIGYW